MNCNEFQLDRYLDDELGRAKKAQCEAHLSTCTDCRARLEVLRLQGQLLREEVESAASHVDFSGFDERVLAGIQADQPAPAGERLAVWFKEVVYHYRAIWVTSLVTAVLVLVVLVPFLSQEPAANAPQPDQRVAEVYPEAKPVDNEVIIDSMEYAGQRSMIFTVSQNNTTVIWLYDFDKTEQKKAEGDDI